MRAHVRQTCVSRRAHRGVLLSIYSVMEIALHLPGGVRTLLEVRATSGHRGILGRFSDITSVLGQDSDVQRRLSVQKSPDNA